MASGEKGKGMDGASKVKCAQQVMKNIFLFFCLIVSCAMSWHEQCILYSGKSAKVNTSLQLRNTVWRG